VFVGSVALAVAANQLGWVAAEVGRQPWTVHPRVERDASGQPVLDAAGHVRYVPEEGLRTSQAVSEAAKPGEVLGSLVMFWLIYLLVGAVWLYVLNHKTQKGPSPVSAPPEPARGGVLEVAAERVGHEQSLSEAKEPAGDGPVPAVEGE